MMRKLLLILLFTHIQCFSQNVAYDSLYNKITKEFLVTRPIKALVSSEQLFQLSNNEKEKANAVLIRAWILRQHGLKNEAIKVVSEWDGIFTKNIIRQIYSDSFLPCIGKVALFIWGNRH